MRQKIVMFELSFPDRGSSSLTDLKIFGSKTQSLNSS